MTDPCCAGGAPVVTSCPQCGERAAAVDTLTVKALLTPLALRELGAGPFRFCASPRCEVVYFGDGQRYTTGDIRVAVWQKAAFGCRTVCYCFGENEAEMRREIETTGASAAASRVREHIAATRCACEVRNPRGVCCLGDLLAAVARVQANQQAAVS